MGDPSNQDAQAAAITAWLMSNRAARSKPSLDRPGGVRSGWSIDAFAEIWRGD